MTFVVEAKHRDIAGKRVRSLRNQGIIPAIIYGNHKEPQKLSVEEKAVHRVFDQAGESTLVDLRIGENPPVKVLFHQMQTDPVSEQLLHVDFLEVNMSEKISAEVELAFVGESKVVKELGGILIKNRTTVDVECLPQDLVHEIDVDISKLVAFEDHITVKDLVIPSSITITNKLDDVIVLVTPPRSEKELEELNEQIEEKVEDVEVEKKGKEEIEGEETTTTEEEPKPKKEEVKKEKS